MKYQLFSILILLNINIWGYNGSFDYCVTTFEDGGQECRKHARGLGYTCETVKPSSINGRRVRDVHIVSKSECEYINMNKNGHRKVLKRKNCEDVYWDLWEKCMKNCGIQRGMTFRSGSREDSCVDSCFMNNGCKL